MVQVLAALAAEECILRLMILSLLAAIAEGDRAAMIHEHRLEPAMIPLAQERLHGEANDRRREHTEVALEAVEIHIRMAEEISFKG